MLRGGFKGVDIDEGPRGGYRGGPRGGYRGRYRVGDNEGEIKSRERSDYKLSSGSDDE